MPHDPKHKNLALGPVARVRNEETSRQTITLPTEVWAAIRKKAPPKGVSALIETAVRKHLKIQSSKIKSEK